MLRFLFWLWVLFTFGALISAIALLGSMIKDRRREDGATKRRGSAF